LLKILYYFFLNFYYLIIKSQKPDLVLIIDNSIFIIEFKYQNGSGSVAEKLQTGKFKKLFYSDVFPKYNIHYIYILSP
jgi:hypothetical protein